MEKSMQLPEQLFKRLEAHARGFDTPANVIERILDYYEATNGAENPQGANAPQMQMKERGDQLTLVFSPSDEDEFKTLLLQKKIARVELYKIDGGKVTKTWRANSFSRSSSLRGNLLSGYLRGWREKGIYKAEVIID